MLGMAAVAVLIATIAYNATRKYLYHTVYTVFFYCVKNEIYLFQQSSRLFLL
jgi:hypothetical protein